MRDPETLWPGNVTVRCPNCGYEEPGLLLRHRVMEQPFGGRYVFYDCPNCGTRVRDYENRHRWVEHREEEEEVTGMPPWFLLVCAGVLLAFVFMAIMARAGY